VEEDIGTHPKRQWNVGFGHWIASNTQFKWHERHPLTSTCPTLINNFCIKKIKRSTWKYQKLPWPCNHPKKLFESIKILMNANFIFFYLRLNSYFHCTWIMGKKKLLPNSPIFFWSRGKKVFLMLKSLWKIKKNYWSTTLNFIDFWG
jgi:hypothetical protein